MADDEEEAVEIETQFVAASTKAYLSNLIRQEVNLFFEGHANKSDIICAVESWMHFCAKARHRGALVALACLIDAYNKGHDVFTIAKRTGRPTTYTDQCFNINQRNLGHRLQLPSDIVEKMEGCYPVELVHDDEDNPRPTGYPTFIHYLSKQWTTNALNHFKMNFYIFQRRTVFYFLQSHGHMDPNKSCPKVVEDLMWKINNWEELGADEKVAVALDEQVVDDEESDDEVDAELTEDAKKSFFKYHRSFFKKHGLGDVRIDTDWVDHRDSARFIPLYFVHLLSYLVNLQEKNPKLKVKLFHPIPVHKMTACYIEIDNRCLYYILRKAGLIRGSTYRDENNRFRFPDSEAGCVPIMRNLWPLIFRTEVGASANRMHYDSFGLSTNSVMASLMYVHEIPVVEEEEDDSDDDDDGTSQDLPDEDPQDEAAAAAVHEAPVNVAAAALEDPFPPPAFDPQDEDAAVQAVDPPTPQDASLTPGIIRQFKEYFAGVDPGLVDLYVLAFIANPKKKGEASFSVDSIEGYFEFSKAAFFHETKINSYLVKNIQSYQAENEMNEVYQSLSRQHMKTTSLRKLYSSISLRTRVNDIWNRCWRMAFNKKLLRDRAHVEGLKKGTLQKKMNEIKNAKSDGELKGIGYGNGNFRSAMRGSEHGGAPTRKVKQAFAENFPLCQEIDEFRTSSVCPCCGCQLFNLFHWHKGKRLAMRGIKYCASDECEKHRFWHRDRVGALNILQRFLFDLDLLDISTFPFFLQRTTDHWRNNKSLVENGKSFVQHTTRSFHLTNKQHQRNDKKRNATKRQRKKNRYMKANKNGEN